MYYGYFSIIHNILFASYIFGSQYNINLITPMKTSLSQFFENYKNIKLDQKQKDKIYNQFLSKIDTNFSDNQIHSNNLTSRLNNIHSYLKNHLFGYRVALVMLLIVFVMFSTNIKDFILDNYIWYNTVYADSIGQVINVDGKYAIVVDDISYQTNKIYDWSIMVVQTWSKIDFVVNEKIVWNIYWPAKLSFKKTWNEYTLNLIEWDQLELHSVDSSTNQPAAIDDDNNINNKDNMPANKEVRSSDDMRVTLTTPKFIAKTTHKDIDLKVSTHGTNQVVVNQNGSIEISDTKWDKAVLLDSNQYAIIDNEIKLFKNMAKLDEDIAELTSEINTIVKTDKQSNLDELKDIYSTKIKQDLSTGTDISHTDYDLIAANVDKNNNQSNSIDTNLNAPIDATAAISDEISKIANTPPIDTTISTDDSINTDISSNITIEKNNWNEDINDILSRKKLLSQEQLYTLELINSNYISWWSLIYMKEYIIKWCKLFWLSCLDTDDDSTLKIYLNRIITTAKNNYYIDHAKLLDMR